MWGASGGDAEAVEDVEDDGEVVEGDVGGSGVEAEDLPSAYISRYTFRYMPVFSA